MFSQIAQVFSSHGVVRPGIERTPVYGKNKGGAANGNANAASAFSSQFDQASAKLELSKQGVEKSGGGANAQADAGAKADPASAAASVYTAGSAAGGTNARGNLQATLAMAQSAPVAQAAQPADLFPGTGGEDGASEGGPADPTIEQPGRDARQAYSRASSRAGSALSVYG